MNNKKQILFLSVTLLILFSVSYWDKYKSNQEEIADKSKNKIVDLDPGQITKIILNNNLDLDVSNHQQFTLQKFAEGRWRVVEPIEYAGDSEAIDNLLETISKYKMEKSLEKPAENFSEYGLNPSKIALELFYIDPQSREESSYKIEVGDNTTVGYNVYFTDNKSKKVMIGSQYLKVSLNKKLHEFRDKSIINIPDNYEEIEYNSTLDGPIVFSKDRDGLKITSPQEVETDVQAIEDLLTEIRDGKASGFLDKTDGDFTKSFIKNVTVSVSFKQKNQQNSILQVSEFNEKAYAKSSSNPTYLEISSDLPEKLKKTLMDFRKREIFNFEFAKLDHLSVDGKKYKKSKDNWYLENTSDNQQEIASPASSISSLLIDLEYAKTDRFIDLSSDLGKTLAGSTPDHKIIFKSQDQVWECSFWKIKNENFYWVQISEGKYIYRIEKSILESLNADKSQNTDLALPDGPGEKSF